MLEISLYDISCLAYVPVIIHFTVKVNESLFIVQMRDLFLSDSVDAAKMKAAVSFILIFYPSFYGAKTRKSMRFPSGRSDPCQLFTSSRQGARRP